VRTVSRRGGPAVSRRGGLASHNGESVSAWPQFQPAQPSRTFQDLDELEHGVVGP